MIARYTDAGATPFGEAGLEQKGSDVPVKAGGAACIDEAYELPDRLDTVGHSAIWLDRYPRSARTNKTNRGRVNAVLDLE